MLWVVEVLIVSIFTFNFIKRERPNVVFFFLGFLFAIVAFVLKLPLLYLLGLIDFENTFSSIILSGVIIAIVTALINEVTRYLSLKRFLRTRSYKNGILFGIGWAAFTIIIFFQEMILTYFGTQFSFLQGIVLENVSYNFLEFTLVLTTTLAQSVFIVFAVLKKQKRYLVYSILYSILIFAIVDLSLLVTFLPEFISATIIAIIMNVIVFFGYKILR